MGQYWKLVNVDKRQTFGNWGKMGEWFFGGSPLQPSLSTIPKLPACDDLLFPFKPGAMFLEHVSHPLYFPKTAPPSSTALLNLPVETIHEIYSHLEDLADLFCLSMACQFLWEIGRREIYRHLASLAAGRSWAGDRIICVGDYLENDDIPESILTPEEEEEFTGEGEDEDGEVFALTLYSYPCARVPEDMRFDLSSVLSKANILERLEGASWRSGGSFFMMRTLHALCDTRYRAKPVARTQPGVLRNLSRCQYIRESALFDLKDRTQDGMPEINRVDLGDVVLSRICFSSDPSIAMSYDGGIHRGVWAGDRFDIVDGEWLQGSDDDASWTDVSDEVMKEVEAIWWSEYLY
ncbi:hypothetical protein FB451DRAFT_1138366 [Mycena latifolia]|nr:hypothetical protein FB451DRAFT_1138366 [Mycena latifolia]